MDREFIVAYAIATYATTLSSMDALAQAGVAVGYGTPRAVRRTLIGFAAEWESMHGNLLWREERLPLVIEEARALLTNRQQDVDQLEAGLTGRTESE